MGNYWDILSNAAPIMIACMFEVIIENINMHFATNKQMMAGIGMANILVHCVGGSLIKGFITGFTGLASRAFGAQNKLKYKKTFIQGLTNIGLLLGLFILIALFSNHIVNITGQSKQIADYSYKTMIYHLPGFCFYYITDFLWGVMNSQKVFRPVLAIQTFDIIIHIILSFTISKSYGFYGIIISTNITFLTIMITTIIITCNFPPWKLSTEMFEVENPYEQYKTFFMQCFYIAFPYFLNFSIFQCMTLYLGSFKLNNQTIANVALTNLQGIITSPHLGYSIYTFTRIGHFIGENQPEKIKSLIKQTIILTQITCYTLLFLIFIFRQQVGSYYFKDHDVFKYFFIGINFFMFRGLFQGFKMNSNFVFRAFGIGSQLVKLSLFSYYIIGAASVLFLCRFVFDQLKLLGVWIGFFIGQLGLIAYFIYKYLTMDINSIVKQLHEEVKIKEQVKNDDIS